MHLLSSSCVGSLVLVLATLLCRVSCTETVVGLYGETLEIPCNKGAVNGETAIITQWKYLIGNEIKGELLSKPKNEKVSINANDEYKGRIDMAANFSLLLTDAKLTDQRTFTCAVVEGKDINHYYVNVVVYKAPEGVEISDKAEELEFGKLTKLATCVARDANPAAKIIWLKNNKPLSDDGKGISIQTSEQLDPVTKLSTTTTSTLEYSAKKEDKDALFSCSSQHTVGKQMTSSPLTFPITYPTEQLILQVIAQEPLVEGDNVTLKCVADGNPAPSSFNFHLKGNVVTVNNTNIYTLTDVSRDTTGEYKCSLIDNSSMVSSKEVTVNYLDINLSPTGRVVKKVGEALDLTFQSNSSGASKVSWTKDKVKLLKEPKFHKLTYSDSGHYECEVTMRSLIKKLSFKLLVEGAPVIKQLSKHRGEDGQHKVLICEAEGSPKPSVSWSINSTSLHESPFVGGKVTHKITVVPTLNLTVLCTVSNKFGEDTREISVSPQQSEDGDQTKLVVGVVVGLLIVAMVIGLAYGIYQKKSKQGSWKTGERENGSSEEEKKLEEKVEENSQKAEV
ncbi:CD166 antigen homolog isoform X2 [Nerophis lumbriciformis]|uniref:CD166 antigen homolog isoform X2 n=1 Tax=Nerophis lumbriciformis TaxID=546530 RepID=UPI002ADF5E8A|nr:CD166 antigen homolog isoform X2 [Nerophis lumbriciformis]